ncbi:MAG: hypothetical protein WBE46_09655 [Dehalococcoidia bacterium]
MMVYSAVEPEQLLEAIIVAQGGGCAPTGTAAALRASIRPRANTILIIFLTSFLLSCSQVFPEFQAV